MSSSLLLGVASPVGALRLGFVLGLRHALDPDHLAAVAAAVLSLPLSGQRHEARLLAAFPWADPWAGGGW